MIKSHVCTCKSCRKTCGSATEAALSQRRMPAVRGDSHVPTKASQRALPKKGLRLSRGLYVTAHHSLPKQCAKGQLSIEQPRTVKQSQLLELLPPSRSLFLKPPAQRDFDKLPRFNLKVSKQCGKNKGSYAREDILT
eukprot:3493119-Amphidinium_carterae.1